MTTRMRKASEVVRFGFRRRSSVNSTDETIHDERTELKSSARLLANRMEWVICKKLSWRMFAEWKMITTARNISTGSVKFVANCRHCPSEVMRLQREGKKEMDILKDCVSCHYCKCPLVAQETKNGGTSTAQATLDVDSKDQYETGLEKELLSDIREHMQKIVAYIAKLKKQEEHRQIQARLKSSLEKVEENNRTIRAHECFQLIQSESERASLAKQHSLQKANKIAEIRAEIRKGPILPEFPIEVIADSKASVRLDAPQLQGPTRAELQARESSAPHCLERLEVQTSSNEGPSDVRGITRTTLMSMMASLLPFSTLSDDVIRLLCRSARVTRFPLGFQIALISTPTEYVQVIYVGEVDVYVDGKWCIRANAGKFFGNLGFEPDPSEVIPGVVTVVGGSAVQCIEIPSNVIKMLLQEYREVALALSHCDCAFLLCSGIKTTSNSGKTQDPKGQTNVETCRPAEASRPSSLLQGPDGAIGGGSLGLGSSLKSLRCLSNRPVHLTLSVQDVYHERESDGPHRTHYRPSQSCPPSQSRGLGERRPNSTLGTKSLRAMGMCLSARTSREPERSRDSAGRRSHNSALRDQGASGGIVAYSSDSAASLPAAEGGSMKRSASTNGMSSGWVNASPGSDSGSGRGVQRQDDGREWNGVVPRLPAMGVPTGDGLPAFGDDAAKVLNLSSRRPHTSHTSPIRSPTTVAPDRAHVPVHGAEATWALVGGRRLNIGKLERAGDSTAAASGSTSRQGECSRESGRSPSKKGLAKGGGVGVLHLSISSLGDHSPGREKVFERQIGRPFLSSRGDRRDKLAASASWADRGEDRDRGFKGAGPFLSAREPAELPFQERDLQLRSGPSGLWALRGGTPRGRMAVRGQPQSAALLECVGVGGASVTASDGPVLKFT